MTQSMEGNVRKLIGWLLACIVAINSILEGGIWCRVTHHGAVRLGTCAGVKNFSFLGLEAA